MKFSCHIASEALKESLTDMEIIDKKTGKPVQDYFELGIEEGPILGLARKAYDMEGIFHVGCTLDLRPPSSTYSVNVGNSNTKKGLKALNYKRELRLTTFCENDSFRKQSQVTQGSVRDLDRLAKAFNQTENYQEVLGFYWRGWSGMYSKGYHDEKVKGGFIGAGMELDFENNFCTGFDGVDSILGNRIPGFDSPLSKITKDTKLETIAKTFKENEHMLERKSLTSYNISTLGIKLEDLMLGILQTAEKVLPSKIASIDFEQEIAKACSRFSMAPKDYDFSKETDFYFNHGGGTD